MKKIALCFIALFTLSVTALFAQNVDVTGTWQGALNIPTPNRYASS
jgi:hypothetical protein